MKINERIRNIRKDVLKINQGAFAKEIGFDQSYISQVEQGKVPPSDKFINSIAGRYGYSVAWVRTGENEADGGVKQPDPPYEPHAGWKPRSIEEMTVVPKGLGMGHAVELLAKIYQSKNQEVIRAIFANLQVFSMAIDHAEEIAELKRDVDELKVLAHGHAKNNAYYGEDRRSGIERRRITGAAPNGIERRDGADRRKTTDNGAER